MPPETGSHSATYLFMNDTGLVRTIFVEPWGEDYTLLPDEELEIIATSDLEPPWFNIVEYSDGQRVYIEGRGSNYPDVMKAGIHLACGHQREVACAAGLQWTRGL